MTKLGLVYEAMAATFAEGGLCLPAVKASRFAAATWLPHLYRCAASSAGNHSLPRCCLILSRINEVTAPMSSSPGGVLRSTVSDAAMILLTCSGPQTLDCDYTL